MTNTLDLDPEWGAIDLIEEIEAAFDFTITKNEAESCVTIGDIYRVICDHTLGWQAQGGKCASSMTFYRLRNSLYANRSQKITPHTSLQHDDDIYRLFKRVGRETGLRLPLPQSTAIGNVGGYLFSAALIAGIVTLLTGHFKLSMLAVGAGMAGTLFIWADRGRLPMGVATIGDLVRRTAPLNASRLQAEGGRPSSRWEILSSLAAEHGILRPDQITPETFLHRKSMDLAAIA